MIKTYSFYDGATGLFTGKQVRCDDASMIAANLPAGTMALEGAFDHLSQRVDLGSGQIVRHQPAAPTEDHRWNPEQHRWQLPASKDSDSHRELVLTRIQALEVSQGRALREAALGDAGAIGRLRDIDDAIKSLRDELA